MDDSPFRSEKDGLWYATFVCPACGGEGTQMEARMYPSGHTEVNVDCELCCGACEVELPIDDPKSDWQEFFYGVVYTYW